MKSTNTPSLNLHLVYKGVKENDGFLYKREQSIMYTINNRVKIKKINLSGGKI